MPGNAATPECGAISPETKRRCVLPRNHLNPMHESSDDVFWGDRKPDMVNHPPHYTRGPKITFESPNFPSPNLPDPPPMLVARAVECIEVIRHIKDMRLATAMKYVWRVAFGGKANDREDIEKAIWYLRDWLDNPT